MTLFGWLAVEGLRGSQVLVIIGKEYRTWIPEICFLEAFKPAESGMCKKLPYKVLGLSSQGLA